MVARLLAVALAVTSGLVILPDVARAIEVPDSARLAALRAQCGLGDRTRVTTGNGVFEVDRPSLDSSGVAIETEQGRSALFVVGSAPPAPRRASWSEIERIDLERSRTASATLAGALAGAALGGLIVAINGPDITDAGDHGFVLGVGVLAAAGGVIGALIGVTHPRLERIYP